VRNKGKAARKLVVPIVLTVSAITTAITVATTAATVVASAGCDDDNDPSPVDAGPPDTPIV
jgi:hypothetical protein